MTKTAREDGYPPTPELDRMKTVSADSHKLGEFYDWLHENGFWICERHKHQGSDDPDEPSGCWEKHICTGLCYCGSQKPHDPVASGRNCTCRQEVTLVCGRHDGEYYTTSKTPEKLLALYFDIDLCKVEDERTAILEWLQLTPEERKANSKP